MTTDPVRARWAAGEAAYAAWLTLESPAAAEMAARGFRFISCAVDTDLLRGAVVEALRATRDPRSAG